jgi:hypothetical protein
MGGEVGHRANLDIGAKKKIPTATRIQTGHSVHSQTIYRLNCTGSQVNVLILTIAYDRRTTIRAV